MKITGIREEVIRLLLTLGAENHPREFAALLIEEDGIICEVHFLPGTVGGRDSASILTDMIPLGISYAGSAHSHPNGVLRPSNADISFFGRTGRCHIIVGYPYTTGCYRCFTNDGTGQQIEVHS